VRPLVLHGGAAAASLRFSGLAWVIGEFVVGRRTRRGRRPRGDPTFWILIPAMVGSIAAAFPLADGVRGASISDGAAWPVIAGLTILWAGLALRAWAIIVLGRWFTVVVEVRPDQEVVQRGPYRLVRHPSYTGLLLAATGLGLALDNWLSLALCVVGPLAGLLVRIRAEEAALDAMLGERYRAYAARTRRLIPGIW
jgi:protein-S-isoprenylcysteine O-methyltransferase Ste14